MSFDPQYLERLISLAAEAKLCLILWKANYTSFRPALEDTIKAVDDLRTTTKEFRQFVDVNIGFEHLPKAIALELRVCELAVQRIAKPGEIPEPWVCLGCNTKQEGLTCSNCHRSRTDVRPNRQ